MSRHWAKKLDAGGIVVLDGATGTELRRRGAELDRRAWSGPAVLSHAELLTRIHADFLLAGADVVTTNTFATSRFVLRAAGLDERFEEINRAAVDAARRARDLAGREADIAGSLSCLPPGFDTAAYPGAREEQDAYLELATLLAEAGVDLLVLEMMEETRHARRACEAARRVGLPFWLGVSARRSPQHGRLTAYDFPNVAVAAVLDALLELGPAAVNVMHTPPDAVDEALDAVTARWAGVVGAYPEISGTAAERSETAMAPEAFGAEARKWVARGARIVGGCCGTTPEHIRAVAEAVGASAPGPA
ncbi:MAG: homocysteine S-methyltransferase family protein [Gammaproteobacteria bacterium]|nr:homocysteine S-methyltransferase family protein [Gammaproteobacteria bacterium]